MFGATSTSDVHYTGGGAADLPAQRIAHVMAAMQSAAHSAPSLQQATKAGCAHAIVVTGTGLGHCKAMLNVSVCLSGNLTDVIMTDTRLDNASCAVPLVAAALLPNPSTVEAALLAAFHAASAIIVEAVHATHDCEAQALALASALRDFHRVASQQPSVEAIGSSPPWRRLRRPSSRSRRAEPRSCPAMWQRSYSTMARAY